MKTKYVSKLWKGEYVSIRDYEAKQAIRKGGMKITHNNQHMELNETQLKELLPTGTFCKSKFGGKSYFLIDVLWNPIVEDKRQEKLF